MAAARAGLSEFARRTAGVCRHVLAEIVRRGPVTGGDSPGGPAQVGLVGMVRRQARAGVAVPRRADHHKTRRGFERVYDLTERVIPPAIMALPTPSKADAERELVLISARAMGVASIADLADYFRLLQADVKASVAALIEAGALEEVRVQGWREKAYLAVDARLPLRATGAACSRRSTT